MKWALQYLADMGALYIEESFRWDLQDQKSLGRRLPESARWVTLLLGGEWLLGVNKGS